jgi:hypothetical protein
MRVPITCLIVLLAAVGCADEPKPECLVNTDCPVRSLCIDTYCESLDGPQRDAGTDADGTADADAEVGEDPVDVGCQPRPEICDGRDNDCDGVVDGQTVDLDDCVAMPNAAVTGCVARICRYRCLDGWVDQNGDLGAETSDGCERSAECLNDEVRCDGVDDNCDGVVDEGCDDDDDGWCDPGMPRTDAAACQGADCDDGDPNRNPGLDEVCNGVDDNCLGDADEGCDDDGDGWCDADLAVAEGFVAVCPSGGGDCDDEEPFVFPEADELCDGLRNDCTEGVVDEGCDDDDDGWADANLTAVRGPRFDALYPGGENDCDDADPSVHPTADEVCDGRDNDCSLETAVDDGCDDDLDGYCDRDIPYVEGDAVRVTCPNGPADCNDELDFVFPGRIERCDNIDNDCAGVVDEGCDDDEDGHCDANLESVDAAVVCVLGADDCDDENPEVYPEHVEVCDGVDNDCDELVDQNDLQYDEPCPLQEGVCAGSQADCVEGVAQACDYTAHDARYSNVPGFGELLQDGLDNDCDGERDETFGDDCGFTLDGEDTGRTTRNVVVSRGNNGLWAAAWTETTGAMTGVVRAQVLDQATGAIVQDVVLARSAAAEPALLWLAAQERWLVVWLSLGELNTALAGATLSAEDGLSSTTVIASEFVGLFAPEIAWSEDELAVGALTDEAGDRGALICTGPQLVALSCGFHRTLRHHVDRQAGLGHLNLLYAGGLHAIYATDSNLYFTVVEPGRLLISSVSENLGLGIGEAPWTQAAAFGTEVRAGWAQYDGDATLQRGVWNTPLVDSVTQESSRNVADLRAFTAAFSAADVLGSWCFSGHLRIDRGARS